MIEKTKTENTKKSKKEKENPYRGREYELFIWWSSLPVILRRLSIQKLDEMGFDTEDPIFLKLLQIKTKSQFAKEMDLANDTITDWQKREDFQERLDEFNRQSNVLKYKKDVDFHFTQMTMKEADASRVKLWKQLYEGYKEGIKLDIEGTITGFDIISPVGKSLEIIKPKENEDTGETDNKAIPSVGEIAG